MFNPEEARKAQELVQAMKKKIVDAGVPEEVDAAALRLLALMVQDLATLAIAEARAKTSRITRGLVL